MYRQGHIQPKVLVSIIATCKLKSHGESCSCSICCVCWIVSRLIFVTSPHNVNLLLMISHVRVARAKVESEFSYCESGNKSIFSTQVTVPILIIVPSCRLKGWIAARRINVDTLPHSIRINPKLLTSIFPFNVISYCSCFRYSVIDYANLSNSCDTIIIINHCSSISRFQCFVTIKF